MFGSTLYKINKYNIKASDIIRAVSNVSTVTKGKVVLTREKDSNVKLKNVLNMRGIETIEVPLINFSDGPDKDKLVETLKEKEYDWITLTSPQAARVFLAAWVEAGNPKVRIATFEEGSIDVINKYIEDNPEKEKDIKVEFTPRISNATTLSRTLPFFKRGNHCVLYPTSSKAANTLEEALKVRQFQVTRLNTYNTESVTKLSDEEINMILSGDVLTVASPSTIDSWTKIGCDKVDYMQNIACIGGSTASRAQLLGYQNVFFPVKPGFDGLTDTIVKILLDIGKPVYGEKIKISNDASGLWNPKRKNRKK